MVDFSQLISVTSYSHILSREGLTSLLPLVYYSVGIALYGLIVWQFHKHLSKRDIFELRLVDGKSGWHSAKRGVQIFLHVLKYVFVFPLYTFIWFSVLSLLLLLLAKNQTLPQILLVSMAVVAAARVTAYYREHLAEEIAKILPYALLGVFLVDRTFLNFAQIRENFALIPTFLPTFLQYALYIIAVELVLRLLYTLVSGVGKKQKPSH